jgi:hypothetical protein
MEGGVRWVEARIGLSVGGPKYGMDLLEGSWSSLRSGL